MTQSHLRLSSLLAAKLAVSPSGEEVGSRVNVNHGHNNRQPHLLVAVAAFSISSAVSFGCDVIATWLDGTSTTVAFIRFANIRSASGGIASSLVATIYQDGS